MKKIQLYIISLWLLFFLIAVKEFVFLSWGFSFILKGLKIFNYANIKMLVTVFFLLLGLFYYFRLTYVYLPLQERFFLDSYNVEYILALTAVEII
jgi:hypothetical protein